MSILIIIVMILVVKGIMICIASLD